MTTTDIYVIMEETFSVQSMPRLYNKDWPPLYKNLEPAAGRVGGRCEMAASL
jgi:hypothetical protein